MDTVLRVLVVDDDEIDRMAVRRALKASGIDVSVAEANNADSAIRHLEEARYE